MLTGIFLFVNIPVRVYKSDEGVNTTCQRRKKQQLYYLAVIMIKRWQPILLRTELLPTTMR